MKFQLRNYRPEDLPAIYALDVVCFAPVFRFSRRAMQRFAEAPEAVTLVAEASADLAGFLIVQMENHVGYVVTLDVAPAWRRQGIAASLMAEAQARVEAAGGVGMELHVFAGNQPAARFYETIGYARIGMADGFYGPGLDALVYGKKFSAN